MILPHVAKHLAVELTTPVLTTSACHDQGSRPDLPHARAKALPMRHPARDQSPISHMQGESSTYETPRPGIKARSPTCKAKALPMRHRGSIT